MTLAHFQRTFTDTAGNVQPSLEVTIRNESTGAIAAIFTNSAGTTPKDNPFTTDSFGYGDFYAADGRYRIQATGIDWRNEEVITFENIAAAVQDAEDAAQAAALNAGIYADTTEGLANTVDGDYFSTPAAGAEEYLTLYRNDAGVATEIDTYPNKKAIDNVRIDLASNLSTKGSDLVAHTGTNDTVTEALDKRTVFVGSVAENISGLQGVSGGVYRATGFHDGSNVGGQHLVFNGTTAKSQHGISGWSPTVPAVSLQAGATLADRTLNYINGVGETDPGGFGLFEIQENVYNVYQYGEISDGSNATDIADYLISVINATGSTGSSGKETTSAVIYYPDGVHDLTSGLTNSIDVDNTLIVGQSPDGTIIKVASNEVFKWGEGLGAGRAHGGGVYQLKFYSDLGTADNTNICISLYKTAHMRFERIRLRDVGGFAKLGDASATDVTSSAHFSDIMGWVANVGKPTFDLQEGAGFRLSDSYIYTNIPAPGPGDTHTAVAGQEFIRGLGNWDTVNVTNVNCNRYRYSINCQPSSGNNCNNWFFANFFGDYSAFGMRWNSDGGNIRNHKYTNVWSFCTEGDSFALSGGATGLLEHVNFTSCQAMLSGDDGWSVTKGKNVVINQCTSQGQGRVSGSGYGVFIDGGDDVRVIGGEHGLDASATTPFTAQADYGVNVTANAKRYTLSGITADGSINGYLIAKSSTQPAANRIEKNRKVDGSDANYVSPVNITVPASGVNYTNNSAFYKRYVMHGGTVTNVQKNGARISTDTNITFDLAPDETFNVTYSAAPVVQETEIN